MEKQEVNFSIKVLRVTQLNSLENGNSVHILYEHGRNERNQRNKSEKRMVEDRMCIWGKDVKPYEFDVILTKESNSDNDWEPYLIYFSLQKDYEIIGVKVQLNLIDYCENGSNVMEVFGVPQISENGENSNSIYFKIVLNIKARWIGV